MKTPQWWKELAARAARSRILLVNGGAALLFTANENLAMLQASVSPKLYGYAGFGLAALNMYLRVTKQSGNIIPPVPPKEPKA